MQEQRNEIRRVDSIPYVPRSPPPSYKSHTTIERPGIHIIFPRNGEFPDSNPPTYRLRNQADRPTILNNSSFIATVDDRCDTIANRFSVSSTAGLVESEQYNEDITPTEPSTGFVNHSFSTSEINLELSAQRLERDYSSFPAVNGPATGQQVSQPTDVPNQGSQSACISIEPETVVLEMMNNDENCSTL